MNRDDLKDLAAKLAVARNAMRDNDTPENEARLIAAMSAHGIKVTRRAVKKAERYKARMSDGSSLEPLSLLDIERMLAKLEGSIG